MTIHFALLSHILRRSVNQKRKTQDQDRSDCKIINLDGLPFCLQAMNVCTMRTSDESAKKTPTTQLRPLNTVRMQNLAKGKCMLSSTSVSGEKKAATRPEVQTQQAELPIGVSN